MLIEGDVPGLFSAPFKIGPTYFSQSGQTSVVLNAQDGRIGMIVRGKETASETAIHLFYVEKKADSSIWTSEAIEVNAAGVDGSSVYLTYGKDNTPWAVVQEFTTTTNTGLHVLHRVGGSWDDLQLEADTTTNRVNVPAAVKISDGVSEHLAVSWNNFVGPSSGTQSVSVMGTMIDMTQTRLSAPPSQALLESANNASLLVFPSLLAPANGLDGYVFGSEIFDKRAWIGRITNGVFSALNPYLTDEKVMQSPTAFYAPCGEAQVVLETGEEADRGDLAKTVRIETLAP